VKSKTSPTVTEFQKQFSMTVSRTGALWERRQTHGMNKDERSWESLLLPLLLRKSTLMFSVYSRRTSVSCTRWHCNATQTTASTLS